MDSIIDVPQDKKFILSAGRKRLNETLAKACRQGDLNTASIILLHPELSGKASPMTLNGKCLIDASSGGHKALLELLISKAGDRIVSVGAFPECVYAAVKNKQYECLSVLFRFFDSSFEPQCDKTNPKHAADLAAAHGDPAFFDEVFNRYRGKLSDNGFVSDKHSSILILSAASGSIDFFRFMLAKFRLPLQNPRKIVVNSIKAASQKGRYELCEWLLCEHGDDLQPDDIDNLVHHISFRSDSLPFLSECLYNGLLKKEYVQEKTKSSSLVMAAMLGASLAKTSNIGKKPKI